MVDGQGQAGLVVSVEECVFGTKVGSESCKSESTLDSADTNLLCPQCSSNKLWRDGMRFPMFGDQIQRWLCRDCGLRFSDPNDVLKAKHSVETVEMVATKLLKSHPDIVSSCQICVSETKNLVAEQQIVKVPQRSEVDLNSAIIDFLWQLKKENKADITIQNYDYRCIYSSAKELTYYNPKTSSKK